MMKTQVHATKEKLPIQFSTDIMLVIFYGEYKLLDPYYIITFFLPLGSKYCPQHPAFISLHLCVSLTLII
jgi:hypothetical protein